MAQAFCTWSHTVGSGIHWHVRSYGAKTSVYRALFVSIWSYSSSEAVNWAILLAFFLNLARYWVYVVSTKGSNLFDSSFVSERAASKDCVHFRDLEEFLRSVFTLCCCCRENTSRQNELCYYVSLLSLQGLSYFVCCLSYLCAACPTGVYGLLRCRRYLT